MKTRAKQAFAALLQRLKHQVGARFPSAVTRIFSGMGQDVGQKKGKHQILQYL